MTKLAPLIRLDLYGVGTCPAEAANQAIESRAILLRESNPDAVERERDYGCHSKPRHAIRSLVLP